MALGTGAGEVRGSVTLSDQAHSLHMNTESSYKALTWDTGREEGE